ncbi:MAG: hypothetical protein VX481_05985 [Cyanobacteriota bacterium]|nr:hypothetical protein [Cyanobacteriota bacterium]
MNNQTTRINKLRKIKRSIQQIAAFVPTHIDQIVIDTKEINEIGIVAEGDRRLIEGTIAKELPLLLMIEQEGIQFRASPRSGQFDQG